MEIVHFPHGFYTIYIISFVHVYPGAWPVDLAKASWLAASSIPTASHFFPWARDRKSEEWIKTVCLKSSIPEGRAAEKKGTSLAYCGTNPHRQRAKGDLKDEASPQGEDEARNKQHCEETTAAVNLTFRWGEGRLKVLQTACWIASDMVTQTRERWGCSGTTITGEICNFEGFRMCRAYDFKSPNSDAHRLSATIKFRH